MKKYWLVFTMSLQDVLSYRLDMFLSMIKYAGVVMLMSFVWIAVGKSSPGLAFSPAQTVTYFVFSAALFSMSNFHTYYIEEDIRLGWLSKYLLKPISALNYYFAHEAAQAFLLTAIKLIIFVPLTYFFIARFELNFLNLVLFLIYLPFIFYFSFLLYSLISIFSFWFQEVYAVRWALSIFFRLLSGAFAPLIFFPQWYQQLSIFLPFQYLLYTPVQLLTGDAELRVGLTGLMILSCWIVIIQVIRSNIWHKGLQSYEGTGM